VQTIKLPLLLGIGVFSFPFLMSKVLIMKGGSLSKISKHKKKEGSLPHVYAMRVDSYEYNNTYSLHKTRSGAVAAGEQYKDEHSMIIEWITIKEMEVRD
jgi:hypothetical protein